MDPWRDDRTIAPVWDWWSIYHAARASMTPILPDQLGRLTLRQFLCLCLDRPPGEEPPLTTFDQFQQHAEAEVRALRRWRGQEQESIPVAGSVRNWRP